MQINENKSQMIGITQNKNANKFIEENSHKTQHIDK